MGRKQSVDFTMTTLQTWQEIIPSAAYEVKGATDRHPKHILINKTVAVDYGGFDRQETVNKFNSAEYVFVAIDQAEELTQDEVAVLRASRRMKIKGHEFYYKGLWTANPAKCWLQTEFLKNPPKENRFVQALPADNPHLPESYVNMLRSSFKHRPELLEAYLHGNWDAMEGAAQVIKDQWIREGMERQAEATVVKRVISIDSARFGDDETVILGGENGEILKQKILPYCRVPQMAAEAKKMSHELGTVPIVVETTGGDLGAGVYDLLMEWGEEVIEFCPQGEPLNKKDYFNLRAEAWDGAAKIMSSGLIDEEHSVIFTCNTMYEKLRDQLAWPSYDFRNGKMLIESKKDIKSRVGKSPDHADAYIIMLWGLDRVEAISFNDWTRRNNRRNRGGKGPMRM